MKRDLRFEAVYEYSPAEVWEVLTDPGSMAEWLMPNDFLPRVGHRFTFQTKPAPGFDGIVRCEVRELDPPRRLAFSWEGGGIDTVVTFSLNPVSSGTQLILEHTGFRGLRGIMVSSILGSGWRKKILPRSIPRVLNERIGSRRSEPQSS